MIDLNKFTSKTTAIVPLIKGHFQYNRKKYNTLTNLSGWYEVEIQGNDVEIINPVFIETEDIKDNIIKGFIYHNKIIFQNFDVGKRKIGHEVMTDLHLNNTSTFTSIEAIIWEDKKLYYYRPNYKDTFIYEIKFFFDDGQNLPKTFKGLTPEYKTLYLFHEIEKIELKVIQEKLQKEKEIEEFKKTLQGRLILAFNTVGGKILNYSVSNNRITVDWELESGSQFNSVINADTFQVIEAGYCMSGFDKDHSLTSMVELAKDYEERDVIYKTRE